MQTSLIGMEACSGAHFLGRVLRKQGHEVSHALDALDGVGRSWRIAMTSPSVSVLLAAVGTGLGVTVRAKTGVPIELNCALASMAPAGVISVTLHRRKSARTAYIHRLAEITGRTDRFPIQVEQSCDVQCLRGLIPPFLHDHCHGTAVNRLIPRSGTPACAWPARNIPCRSGLSTWV
jgi:hypothetical protein